MAYGLQWAQSEEETPTSPSQSCRISTWVVPGRERGGHGPAGWRRAHTQTPVSPFRQVRRLQNGQPSSSLGEGEMSRNPMVRVTHWWSLSQACMTGVQGDVPGVWVSLPSPTFLRALLL